MLATIAAFKTSGNGGLIPQARHGGSGNDSVAIVGSKLEGTGLENEHIGQTQVPTTTGKDAGGRKGLGDLELGEEADATR